MRGESTGQQMMLMTLSASDFVPQDHPLRRIKALADRALADLDKQMDAMYSEVGRPSIPPERLLKACLLIALYTLRSERMLCEQLQYNFLFRWFLDMEHNEEVFDSSVFAKNKVRLLEHDMARAFFGEILKQAREAHLLSDEHFSVDGTLIEAWASQKSFKPKAQKDGGEPPAGRCRACPDGEPQWLLRGSHGLSGDGNGGARGGRGDAGEAAERYDGWRRQAI